MSPALPGSPCGPWRVIGALALLALVGAFGNAWDLYDIILIILKTTMQSGSKWVNGATTQYRLMRERFLLDSCKLYACSVRSVIQDLRSRRYSPSAAPFDKLRTWLRPPQEPRYFIFFLLFVFRSQSEKTNNRCNGKYHSKGGW
jgi:hypothetical protein